MYTLKDVQDIVATQCEQVRKDTLTELAREIDLELSGIATLAKNNPKLAKRCKRLHRILTEVGMEFRFFEEDIKDLN